MSTPFNKVYQFKISLAGVKPKIWRRIQVPETYTFWNLHVAIQDAMGWMDCHLHEFEIKNPQFKLDIISKECIGVPSEDNDIPVKAGWKIKIANYFSLQNKKAVYTYDFGDDWRHEILLEKILPRHASIQYPVCIAGERACPPEDCGGIWGYDELLKILKDPKHEEYESMVEWLEDDFDSEAFKPETVSFSDPKESLKMRQIISNI